MMSWKDKEKYVICLDYTMRGILRKVKDQERALFTFIQVRKKKKFSIKATSTKINIMATGNIIIMRKSLNTRANFLVALEVVKELMRRMKLNTKVHGKKVSIMGPVF